jgi:hypothetical protein
MSCGIVRQVRQRMDGHGMVGCGRAGMARCGALQYGVVG